MNYNIEYSIANELRPIHYLGSKLRILDAIDYVLDSVNPSHDRVCDLFAGSGTVSHHLGGSRPVTAVDIQEYSKVLCSAILAPVNLPCSPERFIRQIEESKEFNALQTVFTPLIEYESNAMQDAAHGQISKLYGIIENGSIIIAQKTPIAQNDDLSSVISETVKLLRSAGLDDSKTTMATRYFGGLYFSYAQAMWIDASLEYIVRYANDDTRTKNSLLAALISATSEIVNTVGKQFAQPLQVRGRNGEYKKNLLNKILSDRSLSFASSFERWLGSYSTLEHSLFQNKHEVLCMDCKDALVYLKKSDVAVVYADPPYTRYHYSRYYHVLETLCLRDTPEISTTFPGRTQLSRGIYRKDRHQSPFCIRSQAERAFDSLFAGVAELKVPFILSYSPFSESSLCTPRMQTIEQLIERAKCFYEQVEIVSPGHFVHSKLNSTEKNYVSEQEAEMLIVCQNVKRAINI